MRYRKLDANDDYSFGSGQLDFYRDVPEAVGQAVKTGLLLWLGEWFLDTSKGTPYMQGVLGKYPKTTADITIQDQTLGITGVTGIASYESVLNTDSRGLDVSLTVDTIYGPTPVQVQNYANY